MARPTTRPAARKAPPRRRRSGRAAAHSARDEERVRWAVVGLGHFAQTAVLPAFAHARGRCELVAVFSSDEEKRDVLQRRHRVPFALPYEELDDFLRSGEVQAVYVAAPNHRHKELTVRAARAGIHVLCEKPMAVTARECRDMIAACEDARVKLMVGYRLHLERANMSVVEAIARGRIGDPRYFTSAFSFQVDTGNVRTLATEKGGGPLYDIGTYCINAARYLFRAEPLEVVAAAACSPDDPRFADTDEQVAAILRFPEERLASFTCSFGAGDVSTYTVVGTKGSLRLEPAYTHTGELHLVEQTRRRASQRKFNRRDQVAPELTYFSDCILQDREPEPSGWEGLHDVRIIEAIVESARSGRRVPLDLEERRRRPSRGQVRDEPPVQEPEPVNAAAPRGG